LKILIIKTSSLGDIIHSFPAIEDIKKNYPESRVDFLVDGTFLSTAKLNQSIDNFYSIRLRETKNQSFLKRLKNLNEEKGYEI
jgi:heptosyltransferase-1